MSIKSGLMQDGHPVLRYMDQEELALKFNSYLLGNTDEYESLRNTIEADRGRDLAGYAGEGGEPRPFSETARSIQEQGVSIEIAFWEGGVACYMADSDSNVVVVKYQNPAMFERAFMECFVAYKKTQEK